MNVRRTTKARRALTAVAITAGLALTVGGCSGSDEEPASESASQSQQESDNKDGTSNTPEEGQVLAEVKGGDNITLTINSASRDNGGFVTVSGKVHNGSGGQWSAPGWQGTETELALKNGASMAGAKLVDKEGKKRYYILRDTEGRCLCTTFRSGVGPNKTMTWYAQFPAPPKGNNKVDFQIADMPSATITISEG